MKKIFLLPLYLIGMWSGIIYGQTQYFEGTVRYDLKYIGEAIAQFASMMPSSYTLKLKGNKSRFSVQGGMMASLMGDVITHADKEVAYILMPQQKVAYKISTSEAENPIRKDQNIVTKVINTGEREKINGFQCEKYKVIVKTEEGEVVSHIWTSMEIAAKFPRAALQNNIPAAEGLEGFPVKVEQSMSQMGIQFTMNIILSDLKEGKIADAEFSVPSDYKIEEGLPFLGNFMKK